MLLSYDYRDYGSEGGEDDDEKSIADSAASKRAKKKPVKKTKKKGKAIRVNLAACKYEVLRVVLKKLGWKEVGDEDEWQLYWTDTSVSLERIMRLTKTQKINHFCGMLEVCRKKKLSNNIARLQKVAPVDFDFCPQTFNLPDEMDAFMELFKTKKKKTYILKPDAGCQGKGIRLAQTSKDVHRAMEELGTTTNVVAQKYLTKPFLIDGLKFDLRIYILVVSCDPLRMHIFREGLARFCTEKYEAPKSHNLATAYMHLTNYAVNKKNENFQFNTDEDADDEGSKWSLAALREWLEGEGHDYDKIWQDISDIAVKTVISIQPLLRHNYRSVLGFDNDGFSCFEILGMDVMLDSKLKPWLIECNHSPSFGIDTPLDLNIKEALISDTIQLARIDSKAIKRQKKEDKKAAESRLYGRAKGGSNIKKAMTAEEVEDFRASVLAKREEWETEVLPNTDFERIYPNENIELQACYERLLDLSAQLFEKSVPMRNTASIAAIQQSNKKKAEVDEDSLRKGHGSAAGRKRDSSTSDQNAPALTQKNSAKMAHDILDNIVARTPSGEQGAPPLSPPSLSSPGSPGTQGRSSRDRGISTPSSRGRFLGRQNSIGAALLAEDALDELARSIENAMEVNGEEEESSRSRMGRGKLGHHAARLARKHDLLTPAMADYPATGGALSPRSMDQGMRYLQEKPGADRNGNPSYSIMRLEQLNPDASLEGVAYGAGQSRGRHNGISISETASFSNRQRPVQPRVFSGRRHSTVEVPTAMISPAVKLYPPPDAGGSDGRGSDSPSDLRPPSGGFPARRQSAKVRPPPRGVGSIREPRLPGKTYGGVYDIIHGAPGSNSAGLGADIPDPPAVDVLDDYMDSYAVKRLWSPKGPRADANISSPAVDNLQPPEDIGELLIDDAAVQSAERRFSGLTIRGIRPR